MVNSNPSFIVRSLKEDDWDKFSDYSGRRSPYWRWDIDDLEDKGYRGPVPSRKWPLVMELKDTAEWFGDCLGEIDRVDRRQMDLSFSFVPSCSDPLMQRSVIRILAYFFKDCSMHRIRVYVPIQYTSLVQNLEILGVRRELLLRGHGFHEGGWRDEYLYAILAREWQELGHYKSRYSSATQERPANSTP